MIYADKLIIDDIKKRKRTGMTILSHPCLNFYYKEYMVYLLDQLCL